MAYYISLRGRANGVIMVYNQGNAPACYAFSLTTAVSYNTLRGGNHILIGSQQDLIDHFPHLIQLPNNEIPHLEASQVENLFRFLVMHGVSGLGDYPYVGTRDPMRPIIPFSRIRVRGYVPLPNGIKHHTIGVILQHFSVVICYIDAYTRFLSSFPGNGIPGFIYTAEHINPEETFVEMHMMVIVGIGAEMVNGRWVEYYEVQNSFGIGWGDGGFAKIDCNLIHPMAYLLEAYRQ